MAQNLSKARQLVRSRNTRLPLRAMELRSSGDIFKTAIFFLSLTLEKTRVKVCPALSDSLICGFLSRMPEIISPSGKDGGTSNSIIFGNILFGSDTATTVKSADDPTKALASTLASTVETSPPHFHGLLHGS